MAGGTVEHSFSSRVMSITGLYLILTCPVCSLIVLRVCFLQWSFKGFCRWKIFSSNYSNADRTCLKYNLVFSIIQFAIRISIKSGVFFLEYAQLLGNGTTFKGKKWIAFLYFIKSVANTFWSFDIHASQCHKMFVILVLWKKNCQRHNF